MNDSLISVIIPVYNSAPFLPRCINSVLKQTYRYIEVLLIDDGSSDESGDICEYYATIDSRIKVFHKKNSGTGHTRQFGLEHSRGDFVAFVDNDDYIKPEMYEVMLNALCENYSIDKDAIDYFLIHQANKFMCEKIRKKLKISEEKTPYNIKDFGNTSGATIPLLMVTNLAQELKSKELNLLLATVGVGFSYGGANILTKGDIHCPELLYY